MSGELRRQAQIDLAMTIQSEFGQNIKLSKPDNQGFKTFVGNSNDVHVAIDSETGLMVSGRTCQAVFVLKEILDQFGKLPDQLWKVEFLEISPNEFRVKDVMPDYAMGIVTLIVGN